MLKGIGAVAILLAVCGILFSWQESVRLRIVRLRALCSFYHRAHYAFETEKMRCIDFFESCSVPDLVFRETLLQLAGLLESFAYPTGEEAWEAAFSARRREWGLSPEEWELALMSGKAFFGKNLRENIARLDGYRSRMLEYLELEEKNFREKKKVFTPAGLLGGLMLIIILI